MGKFIGKKVLWTIVSLIVLAILLGTIFYFAENKSDPVLTELAKPVIYLYPETETDVQVRLNLDGQLSFTYPAYDGGWKVTAYPDGKLINHSDGNEYSYLFWEGNGNVVFDMNSGFVVAGCDTVDFLREKLSFMGLLPSEYNEFITYWAPKMQPNAYNLIAFQKETYTDMADLEILPAPDSMLRIFMAYSPLLIPIDVPQQQLETFERTGFTVIEWGGTVCRPQEVRD